MAHLPFEIWIKICTENIRMFGSWKNIGVLLIKKEWYKDLQKAFYADIVLQSSKALKSLNHTLLCWEHLAEHIDSLWVCFGVCPPVSPAIYDNMFPFDFYLESNREVRSPSASILRAGDQEELNTLLNRVAPFIQRLSVLSLSPIPGLKEVIIGRRYPLLLELQVAVEWFFPATEEECDLIDEHFGVLEKLRIVYEPFRNGVKDAMQYQDFSWLSNLSHLYLSYNGDAMQSDIDDGVLSIVVSEQVMTVVIETHGGEGIPFQLPEIFRYTVHPKVVFIVQDSSPFGLLWELENNYTPSNWGYLHVKDLTLWVKPEEIRSRSLWEVAEEKVKRRWEAFQESHAADDIEFFTLSGQLFKYSVTESGV